MSFFGELGRRNVIRVGFAHAIVAWLVIQVADIVLETIGAPAWVMQTLILLLALVPLLGVLLLFVLLLLGLGALNLGMYRAYVDQ